MLLFWQLSLMYILCDLFWNLFYSYQGKLLYCNAPPGIDPKGFNSATVSSAAVSKGKQPKTSTDRKPVRQNKIDREFFRKVCTFLCP